jgi:hypothetical protein
VEESTPALLQLLKCGDVPFYVGAPILRSLPR